jgi:Phospholipase/Carboxylesterase
MSSTRESDVTREGVEIETGPNPQAAVIWLHGLGADGHDFEPIVPELVQPSERALRFIFPHAPMRPVTLNGGYVMRAWYDIIAIDRRAAEDESGIRASQALITELIRRENARGIPTERIVLAGFSQGGAMALYSGSRGGLRPSVIPPIRRPRYSSRTGPRIPSCCRRSEKRPADSCRPRATPWSGMRTACRTRCARKKSPTSPHGCGAYYPEPTPSRLTCRTRAGSVVVPLPVLRVVVALRFRLV